MRLMLDFVPRSHVTWRRGVLPGVLLLLCLHGLWQRHQLLDEINQTKEASLARGQGWQAVEQTAQEQASLQTIQRWSDALQRPWEAMLDGLADAGNPDIRLTRLVPDDSGLRLQVNGHTDSEAKFLAYVSRMKASGQWQLVQPQSLEAASDGHVEFQLQLEWKP